LSSKSATVGNEAHISIPCQLFGNHIECEHDYLNNGCRHDDHYFNCCIFRLDNDINCCVRICDNDINRCIFWLDYYNSSDFGCRQ